MILFSLFLTSFNSIPISLAVDDNYSTYLYNQDVNVYNDKAHLFQENSDGSNGYRNLFQNNFLFPAKLQNNMLSTSITDSFSHYSFNQYYFDNLDNVYNYQSNNNSENIDDSIILDNSEIANGNFIKNGSIENQDSELGYYNSTYNFDDYQETYSNFGNYNGTYSFENEVGLTNTSISFIDLFDYGLSAEIMDNIDNHNSVLLLETIENWKGMRNIFNNQENGYFEFWIKSIDGKMTLSTMNAIYTEFTPTYVRVFIGDGLGGYYSNTYYYDLTEWSHIKISFDSENDCQSVWINQINLESEVNFIYDNDISHINNLRFILSSNSKHYLDAIGYSWNNYNENDNTNPYGIQSELENNFTINYNYGKEYYIQENDNYNHNSLNITSNSENAYALLLNEFSNINIGSIEFLLFLLNTNKETYISFKSNNYLNFGFKIEEGILKYTNGGSSYYNSINLNNKTEYHFKIDFHYYPELYQNYNLTINNKLILENKHYTWFYSMNSIEFKLYDIYNSIKIDNLDYSWSIDYYPYRNLDIIPYGNYSFYKSENLKTVDYEILYPNQDVLTEWNKGMLGVNHHDCINQTYYDYTYLSTNKIGYTDSFYFSETNQDFNFANTTLVLGFNGAKVNDESIIININNEYEYIYYFTNTGGAIDLEYKINLTLSKTEINNLYVSFTFNNSIESASEWIIYTYLELNEYVDLLQINIEKEIDYTNFTPVLFTLYYSIQSFTNIYINIYNYDLENYFLIEKKYFENFKTNSFVLNESAYFRYNSIRIKIECVNNSNNFNLFIDMLKLNITYVFQNNLGYQELIHYNHRYDNSNNYVGYNKLEFRIYNNSIKYRYSEINFYASDYIYSWIIINTSNINVKNIEIQTHCRFGLNTLDIEIVNIYYIIYINYNPIYTIEFREQSRKEFSGNKIKSSFNFTTYNHNFLNQTGIIGNYSYNCFQGCRSLYGNINEIFHRYFTIPYFSQDIEVNIPLELPTDSYDNPNEPDLPTDYYWTYETYRTNLDNTINFNVGNWSIEFRQMKQEKYTAKYSYQPQSFDKDDFPSFKYKFKFSDAYSFTVDLNFFRNFFVSVLNFTFLFIQRIGFYILSSASYITMFVGTLIMCFIWNYMIYYLYYSFMYVLWYLYEGLYLLIEGLIWLYEIVILPFLYWIKDYLLPILIDGAIYWFSWCCAWMLYLITFGQIDREATQQLIYDLLWILVIELYNWLITFINNIVYILLFIVWYLICMVYLYLRYLIARARGFKENAERYYYTLTFFIVPIRFLIDWIKDLLGITPYF